MLNITAKLPSCYKIDTLKVNVILLTKRDYFSPVKNNLNWLNSIIIPRMTPEQTETFTSETSSSTIRRDFHIGRRRRRLLANPAGNHYSMSRSGWVSAPRHICFFHACKNYTCLMSENFFSSSFLKRHWCNLFLRLKALFLFVNCKKYVWETSESRYFLPFKIQPLSRIWATNAA